MQVFHKLEDVPADFGPTVASVGNFDGVHRAHRFVLSEIVKRAKALKAKSMAVTFEPHPTRILRPDSTFKLLTPTPEKLRLLAATGVDAVLLLPFTRDLSLMTPRQFAHEILKKRLRACEVHEGYNFHFGHKASGNIQTLRELGREMGFEVHDYPEMRLRGEPVSSSHIRQLLRARSAFFQPQAAGAATDRSTPCQPSTWRATKSLYRKTASTSPAPAWETSVLIRSPISVIVRRSAPILSPSKAIC